MNLKNINMLVKMYAGSHAYGTALPTSDVDFRGIFCANPINIRTPFFPVREVVDDAEEDTKYYELAHFMKLCLDCNPNIIELLWTDDEDIVFRTLAYDLLRSYRQQLLSSKIAFTTSGYALSQLARMKNAKKHVNYLPDLIKLCEILSLALKDDNIDKDFIVNTCGEKVLKFMEEKGYCDKY